MRGGIRIRSKKLKRNVPIYKQLEAIFAEEILSGVRSPGARFPSEREICEAYGVSVTPVRRALQSLNRRKLVRRRRGSGTFVAEEISGGGPITLVFHKWIELSADPVYRDLLEGVVEGAGSAGLPLVIEQIRDAVPTPEVINGLLARMGEMRSCGALFLGEPEESLLRELSAAGPVLQVGHHLDGDEFGYVGSDVSNGVQLACGTLVESGAKLVAYYDGHGADFDSADLGIVPRQKLDAYVEWCGRSGLDPVRPAGTQELLGLAGAMRSKGDLLGVLAYESLPGAAVVEAAGSVGLRAGRDLVLIAFDNGGRGDTTRPRMSAVKTFSRAMGLRSVEALLSQPAAGSIRETVGAELIRRDTCGEIGHNAL